MMSLVNELGPFEEKLAIWGLDFVLTLSLLDKMLATGRLQISQILSDYIFLESN
jgi:hypothetical protein